MMDLADQDGAANLALDCPFEQPRLERSLHPVRYGTVFSGGQRRIESRFFGGGLAVPSRDPLSPRR